MLDLRMSVDMMELYKAFSLDVMASTAFGIRIDSLRDPHNPIVSNAQKFFGPQPIIRALFEVYLTFLRLKRIRPSDFESFNYFTRLIERITREKRFILQRKMSGSLISNKKMDFIQMFLNIIEQRDERLHYSIEEEPDELDEEDRPVRDSPDPIRTYGHEYEVNEPHSTRRWKSVSVDEVKAQGMLLFMAGYSGNASLLSNISFLLAKNPKKQEKLIQEIDSHSNRDFNYDSINNLKYLDAVVWEALRLYPPIGRVERQCAADHKLEKGNIVIPAGMTISIPIYAIHRDPMNFENPDDFIPERFFCCDESKGLPHPWCFLPFGGGPRNCLGQSSLFLPNESLKDSFKSGIRLAMLEAKLCIAQVLRRYRFHPDPGKEIEHISDQVLITPKNAFLRLEERQTGNINLIKKNESGVCTSKPKRIKRRTTF